MISKDIEKELGYRLVFQQTSVFDTVAKKSSSFLDILHKTNRKHYVYNSAGELFKRSAILVKLKLYYLQCNIHKVMVVQYYFCKKVCCIISHFSNS